MDIPVKATVSCIDGKCGLVTSFIINPDTNDLTHMVVEENDFPNTEHIVPIKYVEKSNSKSIRLSCTKAEFTKLENFKQHKYYPADKSYGVFPLVTLVYIPYSSYSEKYADVICERIPLGEICFEIGALVVTTDGKIGHVNEFLIDPDSEHITHIVMTEGHLWNKKVIAIPVSKINHIEKDAVYLSISKDQIEAFSIPITALHNDRNNIL